MTSRTDSLMQNNATKLVVVTLANGIKQHNPCKWIHHHQRGHLPLHRKSRTPTVGTHYIEANHLKVCRLLWYHSISHKICRVYGHHHILLHASPLFLFVSVPFQLDLLRLNSHQFSLSNACFLTFLLARLYTCFVRPLYFSLHQVWFCPVLLICDARIGVHRSAL
jgi:hypothetical protein